MEAIDVVLDSFKAMARHPKYILPSAAFFIIFIAVLSILILPPLLVLYQSQNASIAATSSQTVLATVNQLFFDFIIMIAILLVVLPFPIGMYAHFATVWKEDEASLKDSFKAAADRYIPTLSYLLLVGVAEFIILIIIFSIIGQNQTFGTSLPSSAQYNAPLSVFLILLFFINPFTFIGAQVSVMKGEKPLDSLKSSINNGLNDFIGIVGVTLLSVFVFYLLYSLIILFSVLFGGASSTISPISIIAIIISFVLFMLLAEFIFLINPVYYANFILNKPEPQALTRQRHKKK